MLSDTTVRYRHTQRGNLPVLALLSGIVVVLIIVIAAAGGDTVVLGLALPVVVLFTAVLVLFSSMTVGIDGEALRISFGPGLLRQAWLLDQIESWRPVRNPWWYGWGVHRTPGGWLHNVSGFEAIEVVLAGERRCRIGTDDPDGLVAVLEVVHRRP